MRLFLALLITLWLSAGARAQPVSEYEMKALYLINFASYIAWPESDRDAFSVCTLGDDEMAETLTRYENRKIGGQRMTIARLSSLGAIRKCQLLFVGAREGANLQRITTLLSDEPTLLVSDIPLLEHVGIVLAVNGRHLVFDVNYDQCRRIGLKPNSTLLRLARTVRKTAP